MIDVIFDFMEKHPDISILCDYRLDLLAGRTIAIRMVVHRCNLRCCHVMQIGEIMDKYPDDVDRYIALVLEEMYESLFFGGGNMRPMSECAEDNR